jgi:hypothetical protein
MIELTIESKAFDRGNVAYARSSRAYRKVGKLESCHSSWSVSPVTSPAFSSRVRLARKASA